MLKDDEIAEDRIQEVGRSLLKRTRRALALRLPTLNSALMGFAMRSSLLKTQLFRLVDVLPSLRSDEQVSSHVREYLDVPGIPFYIRVAARFGAALPWVTSRMVGAGVRSMAGGFIGGGDHESAMRTATRLRKKGLGVTFDLLGEAVVSEAEAEACCLQYHELFNEMRVRSILIGNKAIRAGGREPMDRDSQGAIPSMQFSVKLSSLCSQLDPIDPEGSRDKIWHRLCELATHATNRELFMTIDMEDYRLKGLTLRIFKDLLSDKRFSGCPNFGIVLQAYLRDSRQDLRELLSFAAIRGPFQVRLVKGAYWDQEVANASQNGVAPPVFMRKAETDANYEWMATSLLSAPHCVVRPAFGTHNVRSVAAVIGIAEALGRPKDSYEFQGLYGMGDELKDELVSDGYRVRTYLPYGKILPGMSYLVRRLLENTSNESFLRQGFHDGASEERLLMNPRKAIK